MNTSRTTLMIVGLLLVAAAGASDEGVLLEITVADITPSDSSDSSWGWWDPGKYDSWRADDSSEIGLADVRVLVTGSRYTVVLAGEWVPTLEAEGSFVDPEIGAATSQSLSLETEAYDLGYGRWLGRDRRNGVLPWIGLTHLRFDESRTTLGGDPAGSGDVTETADSDLWGVVIGADASINLWRSVDLVGRVLYRWARGTRSAEILPPDGGGGTVEVEDSIEAQMWGAEFGVRWNPMPRFSIEGGWRLRDQTLDGGPGSFSGPQIKAVFEF